MEVPFSNIDWLNRPPMIEEIASDNEEINNDQEPQVSDVIIFLKEIIMLADLQASISHNILNWNVYIIPCIYTCIVNMEHSIINTKLLMSKYILLLLLKFRLYALFVLFHYSIEKKNQVEFSSTKYFCKDFWGLEGFSRHQHQIRWLSLCSYNKEALFCFTNLCIRKAFTSLKHLTTNLKLHQYHLISMQVFSISTGLWKCITYFDQAVCLLHFSHNMATISSNIKTSCLPHVFAIYLFLSLHLPKMFLQAWNYCIFYVAIYKKLKRTLPWFFQKSCGLKLNASSQKNCK